MVNIFHPALDAVNSLLSGLLPAWLVVCLLGALSGLLVIGLYALSSPQKSIKKIKADLKVIQAELKEAQDDFARVMKLSKQNLLKALELLGLVLFPALLSAVPAIVLVTWMFTTYSCLPPEPGTNVTVETVPAGQQLSVEPATRLIGREGEKMLLAADGGDVRFVENNTVIYHIDPLKLSSAAVGKRAWWNVVWADGNGYLDAHAGIDELRFGLQSRRLIGGVPGWMSTWEFPYFLLLCISALSMKFAFKIH